MRRWPALLVIGALLIGGLLVGNDADDSGGDEVDPALLLPAAAPDGSLDSAWFCAGQSAGDGTPADGTIIVSNPGDRPATGTLLAVTAGGEGEEATAELDVAPLTTERIRVADVIEGDWVSAQVQVDTGNLVVEHEVVGEHGRDVAPCQRRASDAWWFAAGASTRDAGMILVVYNPSPGPATVDTAFTTESGVREPTDLQGIPVPAGSAVALDVSAVVTEREVIASHVTTRRGRVVVDRIQSFDGRGAATTDEEEEDQTYVRQGLTVTPGIAAPQTVWSFPGGIRTDRVHEQMVVFNPGDDTAEVELTFDLDDPRRNGVLDPFPITVPAGEVRVFDVDEIATIPSPLTHSVTVRSENGTPVVAERLLAADQGGSYAGTTATSGSPVAAERWALPAGPEVGEESARLAIHNPGESPVDVEVRAYGDGESSPLPEIETITIAPGGRAEVGLADLEDGRTSVLVEASAPVVVERRMYRLDDGTGDGDDGESDEEGEDEAEAEEDGDEEAETEGEGGDEDDEEAAPPATFGVSSSIGIPLPPGIVVLP